MLELRLMTGAWDGAVKRAQRDEAVVYGILVHLIGTEDSRLSETKLALAQLETGAWAGRARPEFRPGGGTG
jgi:hypothetical protein